MARKRLLREPGSRGHSEVVSGMGWADAGFCGGDKHLSLSGLSRGLYPQVCLV